MNHTLFVITLALTLANIPFDEAAAIDDNCDNYIQQSLKALELSCKVMDLHISDLENHKAKTNKKVDRNSNTSKKNPSQSLKQTEKEMIELNSKIDSEIEISEKFHKNIYCDAYKQFYKEANALGTSILPGGECARNAKAKHFRQFEKLKSDFRKKYSSKIDCGKHTI